MTSGSSTDTSGSNSDARRHTPKWDSAGLTAARTAARSFPPGAWLHGHHDKRAKRHANQEQRHGCGGERGKVPQRERARTPGVEAVTNRDDKRGHARRNRHQTQTQLFRETVQGELDLEHRSVQPGGPSGSEVCHTGDGEKPEETDGGKRDRRREAATLNALSWLTRCFVNELLPAPPPPKHPRRDQQNEAKGNEQEDVGQGEEHSECFSSPARGILADHPPRKQRWRGEPASQHQDSEHPGRHTTGPPRTLPLPAIRRVRPTACPIPRITETPRSRRCSTRLSPMERLS